MIVYRRAEQKDKAAFGELEREYYKAYQEMHIDDYLLPISYELMPESVLVSQFDESLQENFFFYVAEDNGRVIAYIFAEIKPLDYPDLYTVKELGNIDSLVVSEDWRGKGVGTELIQRAIEWFKSKDVSACTIGVMIENKEALALYEKLGFQIGNMKLWKKL